MFINFITPCTRPHNLWTIYESITIPTTHYRWLVVFDGQKVENYEEFTSDDFPPTVEPYIVSDPTGISGNPQRNLALDKVTNGWIYFLDDDTIVHHDLYDTVKEYDTTHTFLHFRQDDRHGDFRLFGKEVGVGYIDSAQMLTHHSIVKGYRWVNDVYEADGLWSEVMKSRSESSLWINKTLSHYNVLRDIETEGEFTMEKPLHTRSHKQYLEDVNKHNNGV
jgi:hypothetical protein